MTQEGQSATSAKPAPKGLIALRARGLTKRLDEQACIREGFTEKTFYLLKDALETLADEASPAAERTAIIAEIRRRSSLHTTKDGDTHYHVDDSLLDELDAQERAGA
ncbi:MAG: hypothetical protein JRM77_07470 [Nitrososphaerota archaeon]|jgi:hypothetical protein|nr:hypothetical protein [Nitrososphaerota archaeon]